MPRTSQQSPARVRTVTWLLVVAAGCAVLVLVVDVVFVMTARGQLVDSAALQGAQIGRERLIETVQDLLDIVSVSALAVAGLSVAAVAVLRRRLGLAAVALGVVLGSNVTTQLLKYVLLTRPDLGLDVAGMRGNTLPSGHTTVAMSVSAAAVLVAPTRLRWVVALVAATYGSATGVATLSAGYHRPSDAVAASLVVGAWAAGLSALKLVVAPDDVDDVPAGAKPGGNTYIASLLGGVAATLLAGGAVATLVTARVVSSSLDRAHLLVAYAGGAALIAGTSVAVIAAIVAVVHRIVPPLPEAGRTRSATRYGSPGGASPSAAG